MVYLDDLMNGYLLSDMLEQGYVRQQFSPDGGYLTIFNYTNKAMFDNEWNDVTRQCRGLIVDSDTLEVVARPFEKFFNWGQERLNWEGKLKPQPIEVFVKWDGSLGVPYRLHTGELAVATRGSFTSPQALHATEILRTRYADFDPFPDLTYLFEIIYPENRIVVDYQGMDDLVLLAVLETETGRTLPILGGWKGRFNVPVGFNSMAEVLSAPQEANQEGFVVRFVDTDKRVKVKFDEYLRLHKILTNVSTVAVWEALAAGTGLDVFTESIPDEFFKWVKQTAEDLQMKFDELLHQATEDFIWIMKRVRRPSVDPKQRKEFALLALETDNSDLLFGLYDDKDISSRIWKSIRPQFAQPYTGISEDTA